LVREGSAYGQRGNVQQVTEDWERFVGCPKCFLDCLGGGEKRRW